MHIEFDDSTDLLNMITDRVALYGEKTLFTYHNEVQEVEDSYSYVTLFDRAKSVAATLQKESLVGERVLLAYQPGLEFIVGYLACLLAGSIAVPVVPPQNSRNGTNFDKIADNCAAVAVLSDSEYGLKLQAILKGAKFGQIGKYIFTDEIDILGSQEFESKNFKLTDLAFLQYTSGSTSDPKGVMVTHGNLLHNLALKKSYFALSNRDKFVSWLPHFHDMGLIASILLPIYCGAQCSIMSPSSFIKKPFNWLKLISDVSATFTGSPNFGYQLCVNRITEEQLESLDLTSMRCLYCGSEPIRPQTLIDFDAKFRAVHLSPNAITPCYGMAEATLIISGGSTLTPPVINYFDNEALKRGVAIACKEDDSHAKPLVGCGHTNNGQTVLVVNPDSSEPMCDGQIGEIWVSGDSVCNGYWNVVERINEVFHAKLKPGLNEADNDLVFVRSGDLGFKFDDELYVSGRCKDLIIINGKNYYPQDIELVVSNAHPDLVVDGGAAFSVAGDDGLEQVFVTQEVSRVRARSYDFVEIRKSVVAAVSEMFEIELAGFVLLKPSRVAKTSSGKIMRSASKDAYLNNQLPYLDIWFNESNLRDEELCDLTYLDVDLQDIESVQYWLQQLIANYQSLEAEDINILKPIAEYGLTSVTMMKLLGDISEKVDQEVDPTLIWEYPTIDELSDKIVSFV